MTKTKTTSSRRSLAAGAIGNFGEIYDFAVFGFSIPILSVHFFPGSDRTAALLSTFAVYAVAFVARPLGGLMFGYLADRLGRIRVMAMTVWLMALGTAIIGLLPTYATIGIAAPLLLLLCRIAQGLALGGETTGSTSYIVESAPENRRGYWLGFTLIFLTCPTPSWPVWSSHSSLERGIKRIQTGRGASLSFLEALSEWSGSGCAATSMSLKSTSKPARPVKPAKSRRIR
ncbi:MFS transporter [Pseudomonas lini]